MSAIAYRENEFGTGQHPGTGRNPRQWTSEASRSARGGAAKPAWISAYPMNAE